MKAREYLAVHLDRVMKVGPVVNTGLLIATLSITAARLVYWRGGAMWMWILGCALLTVAGIISFAHIWTNKLDMVRAARRASAIHDPCQVYQMHPWERVIWLNVTIPQVEAQSKMMLHFGEEAHAMALLEVVVKMRKWERLGYIPREDYPAHLLHYYWHEEAPL